MVNLQAFVRFDGKICVPEGIRTPIFRTGI